MDIKIQQGRLLDLAHCVEALIESELGRQYFSLKGAEREITRGINAGEIYVAYDRTGEALGFVWGRSDAAFHIYPYLHIVAVREAYRGLGIGRRLIDFCENVLFAEDPKVFLLVADFSPGTKGMYQRRGYVQVGEIPNLYKEGVTEYLMMKEKPVGD